MNYQLVIAEKPSVARSIAGVIGADKKQDGYMEGNGYLVSWCIGHLVSLADAGTYDERFKKWRYDDLPILPQEWQYIIPNDKKKQFDTLRSLMKRPDVTGLVCATDAGREGELIFRFVYQMAGCKKPFQRLWISSMEDAAIKDGFAHLKPGTDYDNLYQSALCRAQADWLVGINATRLFSILYHKTLTVGRVQTPTLKILVDREAKISSFQKEKYHIVQIAAGGMEAASERMGNADDAKALKSACETAQAVCVSVTREKKTEQPPRLYDLTTLQREANRLFGFTAKQTLDYAQQLYEKKLLTYPRTDSQYLTDDMQPTAESLVSGLWPLLPFAAGLDIAPQFGRVLNSKKVSDHHAIVPTMELVQRGFDGLTEGEKKLLSLVCCKLLCAVAAPHVYEAVTATFTCAGNTFTAKILHGRYPPFRYGARRCGRSAGGRRAAGIGNPGHPRLHFRKAGADGLCGAQGKTAASHQGRPQPCLRAAGGADLSPAYGTVGNGADGHCQGADRPGGLHGWHCRNDKGPDRELLPDQRGRAEVVSNRACGYRQMSALRRKRLRGKKELLLRKPKLPVCHVEE